MTSTDPQNVFAANRPRQSLRRLPQVIFAALIVVALVQLALSLARGRYERLAAGARQQQHDLYVILDEVRQTTDELTRMARTFVVTGNPVYESYFNEILAIRDGRKPRPAHYDKVYWDLVIARGQPKATGPAVSLDEIIARAGLTADERARLEELKPEANKLALLEQIAMNAAKGLYRDSGGQFNRRGAPDQSYAIRVLHSSEYHLGRGRVMWLVHQTQLLVEQRTLGEVALADSGLRTVAQFEAGLIALAVLLLAVSFIVIQRRIVEPVEQLSAAAAAVGRNGFFRRVLVERGDELGMLAGALNRMSETVEEKLRAIDTAQERVRQVLAAAPDALIISDGDGHITHVNPRAEGLFEVSRSEAEGSPLATWLPELGAAGRTSQPGVPCEVKVQSGGGREHPMEAIQHVIELVDGNVLVCTALREPSPFKTASEELARQVRLQDAALDAIQHPLLFTDPAGGISRVNQAFEKLFGIVREAVTGHSILELDFIAEAERQKLHLELERLRQPGTQISRELRVLAKDGFERLMQVSAEGMYLADGSPAGTVVILMDVTDRRRTDADLAASQKELARLARESAALQAAVTTAREEAAGLRSEGQVARTHADSLEAELDQLRVRLSEALDAANAAEARARELKLEVDETNARMVDLAIAHAQEPNDPTDAGLPTDDSSNGIDGDDSEKTEPTIDAGLVEVEETTPTPETTPAITGEEPVEASADVVVNEPAVSPVEATPFAGTSATATAEPFAETSDPANVAAVSAQTDHARSESQSEDAAGTTETPPVRRKRTPRKKKDKPAAQSELFGGYDGAKDEAGPVRISVDPDGVPVVSGLDFREVVNRLELPASAVARMIGHFAGGLPGIFGELRSALAAADHDAARAHAHSLAGAAGNFSADALRRLAKTLELALKFEQGDATKMLAELEHEAGRVMEAARQIEAMFASEPDEPLPDVPAPPPGSRKLLTILEELSAVLDEGDLEAIGQAVGRLKAESLPDSLQADYERLSELIDNLEYADAAGIVRSMMDRLS